MIRKMDCASEENIVRMKLKEIEEIHSMEFDIPNRKLTVIHSGKLQEIAQSIGSLNFGSELLATENVTDSSTTLTDSKQQFALLWKVLLINFGFFGIEITTGLIFKSMGLVADSLDMLADALVYGLSLFAVSGTLRVKKRIAEVSGYFQIILAMTGFIEVIRRFINPEVSPDFRMMIIVSFLALGANTVSLILLQKSKSQEAHMKASMVFTSNDVIINMGVIVAGILVYLLDSPYPDLVVGAAVFVIVIRGAGTILKLSK